MTNSSYFDTYYRQSVAKRKLMRDISCHKGWLRRVVLSGYDWVLHGIDNMLLDCKSCGLKITHKAISDAIGFDPWRYLRYVESKLQRADELIISIDNNYNPECALKNTYTGLVRESERLSKRTWILRIDGMHALRSLIKNEAMKALNENDLGTVKKLMTVFGQFGYDFY